MLICSFATPTNAVMLCGRAASVFTNSLFKTARQGSWGDGVNLVSKQSFALVRTPATHHIHFNPFIAVNHNNSTPLPAALHITSNHFGIFNFTLYSCNRFNSNTPYSVAVRQLSSRPPPPRLEIDKIEETTSMLRELADDARLLHDGEQFVKIQRLLCDFLGNTHTQSHTYTNIHIYIHPYKHPICLYGLVKYSVTW
eukprot:m.74806 g.74806  ORF g.74806 m.74806 type:complete len:197 (-) comp11820_c0_seq2:109-699(-)